MATRRRSAAARAQPGPKALARTGAKIKPADELPHRFRSLFYGRTGAGKTRLVSSLDNILLIDVNDEGTDSVRKDYNPDVLPVYYWSEINDAYWFLALAEHQYEGFAIDGLTSMQELCMKFVLGDEHSRDASRDPDMPSRQIYNKVTELMRTQIYNFRNLPMHALFTATERKRFSATEDEDEPEDVTIGPALTPAIANTIERAVGMIGYLHKRQVVIKSKQKSKKTRRVVRRRLIIDDPTERYITKDRYGLQQPFIEAPDLPTIIKLVYGEGGLEDGDTSEE